MGEKEKDAAPPSATAGLASWIEDARRRAESLGLIADEESPDAERERELRARRELHLRCVEASAVQRYQRQLDAIVAGRIQQLPTFRAWRQAWASRSEASVSALIYGGPGSGRSTLALWAAWHHVRTTGRGWAWIDEVQLGGLVARRRWDTIDELRTASLAIVDGHQPAASRGIPGNELRALLLARWRRMAPTILVAHTTAQRDLDAVRGMFELRFSTGGEK